MFDLLKDLFLMLMFTSLFRWDLAEIWVDRFLMKLLTFFYQKIICENLSEFKTRFWFLFIIN